MTISTRRLRHLAAAGLIAAAATVGGSAIGEPATACAEPKELDVEQYDACTREADIGYLNGTIKDLDGAYSACCEAAGGIWDYAKHSCNAPPANQADAPRTLPGNVPTQTFQPAPPPVRQPGSVNPTVTFAPSG